MSLKRKALDDGAARSSKRATPAPSTPVSLDSDDDFSGSDPRSADDGDDSEQEHIRKARRQLDFSAMSNMSKSKSRSAMFGEKDFSWLSLKSDHDNRPIWVDPNVSTGSKKGPKITMEAFSPLAQQATDLLTTIAEPQSRPAYIHEYRLTEHSLYAALSVGMTGNDITRGLELLSKTPVPPPVVEFINRHTLTFGKIRLVLRNNRYWVESDDESIIQMLLADSVIGPCRAEGAQVESGTRQQQAVIIQGTAEAKGMRQANQAKTGAEQGEVRKEPQTMIQSLQDEDDEDEIVDQFHSFEVGQGKRDTVAKRCLDIGYPAISEYDYANDHANANLAIDLKSFVSIRPYQEKALAKMFGNGRAKSGVIVLPCGAGKTLVGITAGCHIGKSIIVLCTSAMSSYQWANEFKRYTDIKDEDIAVFSSSEKTKFKGNAGVLVTTYSMLTAGGKRAHDTQQMMTWLREREWSLCVLDEVHVVPAKMFRTINDILKSQCRLGLTATLLREDDKITDLNFLIGPKLYEANWMELSDQGYIAKVQCAEVWCPMSIEFYQEYQKETSRKQALYYIMNPTKYQVCQYLIDYHEKRGDKIIVFSDNLFALRHYAFTMKKPFIDGDTGNHERLQVLENFQFNNLMSTIFLSKVGDTSLDLPEATVLIQLSSHYGSRRQEAQRLGRILRVRALLLSYCEKNADFFVKRLNEEMKKDSVLTSILVSTDTMEMLYSARRQQFLVDQGYAFKTITALPNLLSLPGLRYKDPKERMELLADVMLQQETAADVEKVENNLWSHLSSSSKGSSTAVNKKVRRQAIMMADASGGGTMAPIYREQDRKSKKMIPESDWFRKEAKRRENLAKKRRKEREAEAGAGA